MCVYLYSKNHFLFYYIIKRKPASLMLLFWLDAQEAITSG